MRRSITCLTLLRSRLVRIDDRRDPFRDRRCRDPRRTFARSAAWASHRLSDLGRAFRAMMVLRSASRQVRTVCLPDAYVCCRELVSRVLNASVDLPRPGGCCAWRLATIASTTSALGVFILPERTDAADSYPEL